MEDKDGIEPVPAVARLAAGRQPDSWPLERGRLVHRLLELLPDLPAVSRMAAAESISEPGAEARLRAFQRHFAERA